MGNLLVFLARLYVGANLVFYSLFKTVDGLEFYPKFKEPADFLKSVRLYGLLPENPPVFLNTTAVLLPWIELVGGVFLIAGVLRRGTAGVVCGMLIVFTTAILIKALGIYGAEDIAFCDIAFDCGCGSGVVVICNKLLYNGSLIFLSAFLAWAKWDGWKLFGGKSNP